MTWSRGREHGLCEPEHDSLRHITISYDEHMWEGLDPDEGWRAFGLGKVLGDGVYEHVDEDVAMGCEIGKVVQVK